MKQKIKKTSRLLDNTIRNACKRIPQKKRKVVVLGLCFLFVAVFSIMLWDSFFNTEVPKIPDAGKIKPLDLPQDTLIHKLKDVYHEQKQ